MWRTSREPTSAVTGPSGVVARGARAMLLTAVPVALVAGACTSEAPSPPSAPPKYRGTALADYDTQQVTIVRGPFCDRVTDEAVGLALGSTARRESSYTNGDRARLAANLKDVAHEHGCTFEGRGKVTARAWLFAPPVTRSAATRLVGDASRERGCAPLDDAAKYGRPSTGLRCRDDDLTTITYRGLFGDAWLSCSLTAPGTPDAEELIDRAGRWCVAVAEAAAG